MHVHNLFTKGQIDKIYGSYEFYESSVSESDRVNHRGELMSRHIFFWLDTKPLVELTEDELSKVLEFPQIKGVSETGYFDLLEGFNFDTPTYLLARYECEAGGDKVSVEVTSVDQGGRDLGLLQINSWTKNSYVLMYKSPDGDPKITFLSIKLEVRESVVAKEVRQFILSREDYYEVLSDSDIWTESVKRLKGLLDDKARQLVRLSNMHNMSISHLSYIAGRVDGSTEGLYTPVP